MTETRRIAYHGSGPLIRTLVHALEERGVAVAVRREGPYVGEHREPPGMGDAVNATLVATGATDAIEAGVKMFLDRFANRAQVSFANQAQVSRDDEQALPFARGRHRA